MTSRTRLVVLFVTAPVLAFTLIGGMLSKTMAQGETYPHLRVFGDVVSLISSHYVEEADMSRVMRGAMRGLADGLDPDSGYLTPEEARIYESGEKPAPAETGIELTRTYYLRVIAVRDGSPAARAGLRAGDFVRAIDDKPTREMSVYEGTRLLRGAPGTKVNLLVIRGSVAEPHTVEVSREILTLPEVTSRVENGVGHLRIAAFGPNVAKTVASEAASLARSGAGSLLVDVRDTATGPYESGVAVAKLFVPSGTLAHKEMRGAARQAITAAGGDGSITLPVAVLVNDGTSGAAELFAAAIAGNRRGTLVGERTQGRAALQKFVRLPDGAAMIVSNGWYLTPSGDTIHEKGLTPEIPVEGPEVEFGGAPPATDPILQKGLEVLRTK